MEDEKKLRVMIEEALRDIMAGHPDLLGPLRRAVAYEEQCNGCPWTIIDIVVKPKKFRVLKDYGLVQQVSDLEYRLVDWRLVKEIMGKLGLISAGPKKKGFNITMSIFDDIVGFDHVKKIIVMALRARNPVHVLLAGPPGIGKSLFVDSVREALIERNECVGHVEGGKGLTTSAGLVDMLLQMPPDTPCLLTIDELDKMSKHDMAVLHRLMVTGEVVITKHNMIVREKRKVWVLATANELKRIPPQIVSRFHVIKFRPLTAEEYKLIIPGILVKREGLEPELAEYIAEKLAPYTRDPRDAIKIARMAYTKEDVDWLIENTIKREARPFTK